MDDRRDDERAPGEWATPDEPGTLHVPQMAQPTSDVPPASDQAAAPQPMGAPQPVAVTPAQPASASGQAAGELSGTAALSADITTAWSKLDGPARLLVNASGAAMILTVIGLPLSVWDSANFSLLVLTAGVIAIVTAWFGEHAAMRSMPIPRSTIELVVTLVAAILAVMKAIEVLFDLDTDGIVGLALAILLVAATVVMVVAATRRGADLRGTISGGDQGTKLALAGLVLVLLGWAFNLSISFWTMGQAALPLAVLALAALTVAEARRIQSAPIPAAWVGAGIAVFGAFLVLGNWNELTTLGRTELTLDPGDFIGILAYSIGTILIIAGGVLSGRSQWTPPQAPMETPAGPDAGGTT